MSHEKNRRDRRPLRFGGPDSLEPLASLLGKSAHETGKA